MNIFTRVAISSSLLYAATASAQNTPTTLNVNLGGTSFQAASSIGAGVLGAGVNGPANAQVGLAVNMNKSNWWNSSAAVGEVDGIYSTVYQGGKGSDTSAFLGQIVATGLGFASVLEGTVAIQPQITSGNGVVNAKLDVQVGVVNIGSQIYGSNYNLSQKPQGATAVGYSMNGAGWDYLAQWWNGSTNAFQVDGAGNVKAAGALQTGVFTTASLPADCVPGQQLYASDARKAGEPAGEGSGVPVICTASRKGSATTWYSLWSGTPVAD